MPPDMECKSAVIDGITMRWNERGQGMPVVFVHGIPTSPDLWRHVIPKLDGVRSLAFEMVGYGSSIPEGKNRDISVGRQADYLLRWLEELGIEKAVLVGHDLGGGVVHIAAIRRPPIAAAMLLTNSIGYDSWPIPSVKTLRALKDVVAHLPKPLVKGMLAPLFPRGHDNFERARESFDVHWSHYQRHDGGAALARQVASLDVNDTLAVSPNIPALAGIPSRVIWGVADQFQPVTYGERFARDLGTTVQRIEGGKHFTPEDHPDEIARGVHQLVQWSKAA